MSGASARRDVKPAHLLGGLAAAALVAFLVSLSIGPAGFGIDATGEARTLIFTEIRLPRAILGALIGARAGTVGRGAAGLSAQPAGRADAGRRVGRGGARRGGCDPLGAVAGLALALPLGGLAGAAVAMLVVVALAGARGGPVTLILAGLAVSSIATALISLALNLSQNPFASVEMVFWMMGSLADRSLTQVWLAAPLMLAGIGLLLAVGRALDALTLGEDAAASLGIDLAPHAADGDRRHGAGRRRGDGGDRHHRLRRPDRAARAAALRAASSRPAAAGQHARRRRSCC